ncbi:hypothetical protein HMPREF1553_00480 [Porphyromonas gingivalis F0568]|nr:hypothetical protein HMPREF1553_00480 [Porphyromonas gingivalis F0568]
MHHTGIKTDKRIRPQDSLAKFQLHHTGIKTGGLGQCYRGGLDFNCTIQELKLWTSVLHRRPAPHFNCTIQELKRAGQREDSEMVQDFNCTIQELKLIDEYKLLEMTDISIAPYRN